MTGAPDIARFEPPVSDATEPFWTATRGRRLVLPWCPACAAVVWFPRAVCPRCGGTTFDWREAPGTGTVYAVTVEHRPQNPGMAAIAPYAVALVDVDPASGVDGRPVRLLTNVVGCDPDIVAVGDAVAVTWEPLSDGRHLPLFRPLSESAPTDPQDRARSPHADD